MHRLSDWWLLFYSRWRLPPPSVHPVSAWHVQSVATIQQQQRVSACTRDQTHSACTQYTPVADISRVRPSAAQCPAGKANAVPGLSSSSACIACLPGSVAGAEGTAVCERCAPGKLQSDERGTACMDCTRGSVCPLGSSTPQLCPGGTHADEDVLATVGYLSNLTRDCVDCAEGTFCPVGSLQPTLCEPGTINSEERQERCTSCAPGTYQNVAGSTACKACLPGHWCTSSQQARPRFQPAPPAMTLIVPCPSAIHGA